MVIYAQCIHYSPSISETYSKHAIAFQTEYYSFVRINAFTKGFNLDTRRLLQFRVMQGTGCTALKVRQNLISSKYICDMESSRSIHSDDFRSSYPANRSSFKGGYWLHRWTASSMDHPDISCILYSGTSERKTFHVILEEILHASDTWMTTYSLKNSRLLVGEYKTRHADR